MEAYTMAPTFPCACLRKMPPREAPRELKNAVAEIKEGKAHRRGAKVPQSRRAKVPQSRNTDLRIMESLSPQAKAKARWQTMDVDLFLTPAQWRHGEIIDGAVAGDNPGSSTARPHTAVAATRPSTAVAATLSDSHFRFLALLPQSRQR